jgi:hypothetical protein
MTELFELCRQRAAAFYTYVETDLGDGVRQGGFCLAIPFDCGVVLRVVGEQLAILDVGKCLGQYWRHFLEVREVLRFALAVVEHSTVSVAERQRRHRWFGERRCDAPFGECHQVGARLCLLRHPHPDCSQTIGEFGKARVAAADVVRSALRDQSPLAGSRLDRVVELGDVVRGQFRLPRGRFDFVPEEDSEDDVLALSRKTK